MKKVILWCSVLFLLAFCKESSKPSAAQEADLLLAFPAHFTSPPPVDFNPINKKAVALGKMLFFDPKLSANGQVACASCHFPQKAFTDGIALSKAGVSGEALHRNSMPLFNLAWNTSGLFWDGGASNLESLVVGPLTHPDEMAMSLPELPIILRQNPEYARLFAEAYPEEEGEINSQKVLKALAQYMRTLVSADAKYDRYIENPQKTPLSALEREGLRVFDLKCNACHSRKQHLFTDNDFHNNGLDDSYSDAHELAPKGRFRVTFKEEDTGKFKTPSLRNLSFTAPYMHDGRFATLEEVLQHYASGIKHSPTLAPRLKKFTLSAKEQKALLAFLKTLDDTSFIQSSN